MDKETLAKHLQVYIVTDERSDGDTFLPILQSAIAGGATAIQLRRKAELGRRFVELGRAIRVLTRDAGVLFFVNDRVDVALLTDADGVHIGQDDISCKDARTLLGNRIIGVSAETVDEARQAEQDGADYLGVGAVYPTQSKPDAGFTGVEGLRTIIREVRIPVVGIGGISTRNAQEVAAAGAHGVAVVSAIMGATDPKRAAEELANVYR